MKLEEINQNAASARIGGEGEWEYLVRSMRANSSRFYAQLGCLVRRENITRAHCGLQHETKQYRTSMFRSPNAAY